MGKKDDRKRERKFGVVKLTCKHEILLVVKQFQTLKFLVL